MAKKRRKARRSSNPRRHAVARVHHRRRRSNHRRRNPMVMANRHHRRRNHRRHYRRNPLGMGSKQLVEQVGGALLGLAAIRTLPTMIPSTMTSMLPAGAFTGAIVSAVCTGITYWAASKFLPPDVARGVAIGGGVLTASQLWAAAGLPTPMGFGMSGVGDIVATAGFAVPDRSMRAPIQMVPAGTSGVGSYGNGMYKRMLR